MSPTTDESTGQVDRMAETLEDLVDTYGLEDLLKALGVTCRDKAEHLRTNWQDKDASKCWEVAGNKLTKLATTPAILNTWPFRSF